jgi:choline dehydrogenase-like flavoprotein
MLIDAEGLAENTVIEGGFVIVGGGVAGLALARQLAGSGEDVAILESGGEQPDSRVQALYEGRATLSAPGNDTRDISEFMANSRRRYLGGTGNVWGGKCAPLDAMDFESRSWVPHSGWPMSRRQLMPYYDRACDLLELPRFDTPAVQLRESLFAGRSQRFAARPRCYTRYTGAARGPHYSDFKTRTVSHPRIRVYLRANVTHIQATSDGARVESLTVSCLNGRKHIAKGHTYVLAVGGIENARLLLASNDVHKRGVGNHSDWLGRGFLVHTTVARSADTSLALTLSNTDLAPYDTTAAEKPHVVAGSSQAAQLKSRTGNFTATLAGEKRNASEASKAIKTLVQRVSGADVSSHQAVYFMVEHTPNRDSRMTLLENERDELGMPRVQLDLHYSDLCLQTLEKMTSRFGAELGQRGTGRLQWGMARHEIVKNMNLSRHHMGATRMAKAARNGVVDAQCRVHGMQNLYVAGSSVFPTSGIANPTLTLLALSFRLGDHLIAQARRHA